MEGTPQPSGPSQTRCCPLNLQVLPSQGYPFAPTSPAGPLNLYPPSLPWLTSSRLQRDCSLIHRTSPDLSGRSCSPRALPFSPRPPNRAPLVSPSSPIAALRTPPHASRLRGSGARLQAGKVPQARPRAGEVAVAASAGRSRDPAARLPHGVLRREWGRRIKRLPVLFGSPRVVEGGSRPLRPGGHPAGLRAPPVCGAVLVICPGAALHARRLPRRRRALGRSTMCGCPCAGRAGAVGKEEGSVCFC